MPTTDNRMIAAGQAAMEAALPLAQAAFSMCERLATLNISTTRAVLEDATKTTQAILGAKDAQDAAEVQASLAQPAIEKLFAYTRSVLEIVCDTQAEMSKQVESELAEGARRMSSALDALAKVGPAGSDQAVAAMKSALAAASSAYGTMNKAAKQVAEFAENNVAVLANAASRSAAPPKSKRAA
jgi:phasin family protein